MTTRSRPRQALPLPGSMGLRRTAATTVGSASGVWCTMASNRSTQTALLIALSIFVMLTFALGVTTYLYFNKAEEAEIARQTAAAEAVEANKKVRQTADEMTALRGIIGVASDVSVAEIETRLTGLFEGDFAGYAQDERSYLNLIEWLRQEYRDKNTRVKTVEEEKKALAAQQATKLAAAEKARQDAEAAAAAAKAAQAKDKEDFDEKWGKHEQNSGTITEDRRKAEDKGRDLENLKTEIAKGLDYMSPARKNDYLAAVEAGDSVKQLDLLRLELRVRAKDIELLNAALAQLRVADRDLQESVAAARPAADRIDGFNGRVVTVDPRDGTALVSCRTTAGLRPGLVLHVFPPDDPRPEFGTRKGTVEVTEVEGPTLVRTVIRRQNDRSPILSGDGVASVLWAGGVSPEIVIVGFADLDNDDRSDLDALRATVERAGGKIVDSVAPKTSLVVDLGLPPGAKDGSQPPGWTVEEKRRSRTLDAAKAYNIRVTGIDGLLESLGLDKESFRPGRLPKERAVGRLPGRR